MKKVFKRNQVIIIALAIIIAVVGYLSLSNVDFGKKEVNTETMDNNIVEDINTDTSGEAVLTDSTGFAAQVRISREQVRSQNKDTLMKIIDSPDASEEQKQEAVSNMMALSEIAEEESAAESLLESQGFVDVVVICGSAR